MLEFSHSQNKRSKVKCQLPNPLLIESKTPVIDSTQIHYPDVRMSQAGISLKRVWNAHLVHVALVVALDFIDWRFAADISLTEAGIVICV
jgi:hypothetical protein